MKKIRTASAMEGIVDGRPPAERWIAAGSVIEGGLAKRRAGRDPNLLARAVTSLLGIPVLLYLIFWAQPAVFRLSVVLFTVASLLEYFRMAFPTGFAYRWMCIALGCIVALEMAIGPVGGEALLVPTLVLGSVIVLLGALLGAASPDAAAGSAAYAVLGILYAGVLLPHFIWLRAVPGHRGPAWILFVIVIATSGDTAAYFAGRRWGRHPLFPAISPKKTVEGTLAALGAGVVGGSAVSALLLPGVSWLAVPWLAVAISSLAQLGDLCESLLKRAFGAKDSGGLLPGHGGVLDRADSLLFPAAALYYLLRLFPHLIA